MEDPSHFPSLSLWLPVLHVRVVAQVRPRQHELRYQVEMMRIFLHWMAMVSKISDPFPPTPNPTAPRTMNEGRTILECYKDRQRSDGNFG